MLSEPSGFTTLAAEVSATSDTSDLAEGVRACLIDLAGPDNTRRFPLDTLTAIGRTSDADIQISCDSVSRHHARVAIDAEGGFVLTDLGSKNGTFVNGARIDHHTLRPGDRIRLGDKAVLLFSMHDPAQEKLLQSQRLQSIGRLAGGVAHEFNNLLSAILGNVSYLRELFEDLGVKVEGQPEEIGTCLGDVESAARRASELTRQLLSFARANKIDKRQASVDLAVVTRTAIRLAGRTFDRSITIRETIEDRAYLDGDADQLHQVLMNLLINARDALPDGGTVSVEVERRRVVVDTVQPPLICPGEYVVATVRDDGVGMDEHTARHLFDPFFTTKENAGGTGLGLSTSYGVVIDHGGTIDVKTKPGQGTTLTIYLPTASRHHRAQRLTQEGRSTPRLPAMTVLLVDDEPDLRATTERLLRHLGHRVLTAQDGCAALDMYEAHGETVDMVLLDLVMPNMNGTEAFRHLRSMNPEAKIMLTSGHSDPGTLQDLLDSGACGFLPKPYSLKELDLALRGAIGTKK